MKPHSFSLLFFFAFPATLFLSGCSQQQTDQTPAAPPVENTNVSSVASEQSSQPPVPPKKKNVERAALDEMAGKLTTLSKSDSKQANSRLHLLFSAADQDPHEYGASAHYLAEQMSDASDETAAFSRNYLIQASVRDEGITQSTLHELVDFATAFPNSDRPIQLYKKLSNQLVADGDGKTAIAMLSYGIKQCRPHRDVAGLERQKRMTVQTISLMGSTRVVSQTRRPTVRSKKETKTSTDSKYHRLIGQRVDLSGLTLDGGGVTSQQLRGKWVYVHFWATWCGACRSGMSGIVEDHHQFAQQVKFVGVNMDTDKKAAKDFIAKEQINWPQLASKSKRGWDAPLAKSLGISSIPTSLLIGPDGKVVEAGGSSTVGSRIGYHLGR